jgi:uncharacterized protein HemX
MKHFIVITVAVLAVIGVGAGAIVHQNNYKNKQQHAAQVKADKEATLQKELTAAQTANSTLKGQYNALQAECMKGKAVYDTLTALAKTKVPAPTCGTVLP